tara:strand:- start:250 stop:468 length:219 start_codon:yes stop_codon:yes gene_type:complete
MRNYKSEYGAYHSKPDQIANRSSRNKARRKMVAAGKAKPGDGQDVDHRDGNPQNNKRANLSVMARSKNRSKK